MLPVSCPKQKVGEGLGMRSDYLGTKGGGRPGPPPPPGQITWEQRRLCQVLPTYGMNVNLWHECELKEYSTKLLCILHFGHPKQNFSVSFDFGKIRDDFCGVWFSIVSNHFWRAAGGSVSVQLCAEWRQRSVPPTPYNWRLTDKRELQEASITFFVLYF